jgi:hypothetical protein
VKTDYDGMQFLSGKKIFMGDLRKNSEWRPCPAAQSNRPEEGQESGAICRRSRGNEKILVGRLETGNLTKEEIRIGDRFYGDFISLDQNLVFDGMETRKPRQTIPVKNLNVKNFVSPGRVFGEDLMGLIQDSLVFNGTKQIVAKKMFLGGLEVEDLRLIESNSLKATIARFQNFLTNDYTGNANFAHELSIKNQHSSGGINGFRAQDLQKVLKDFVPQPRKIE